MQKIRLLLRILSFTVSLAMAVLFLFPRDNSVPVFIPPAVSPLSSFASQTPTETEMPPVVSPSPPAEPSPSANPEEGGRPSGPVPYSSNETSPKYSRESHHYSVQVKFPQGYRVENTLYVKVVINAQLIYIYKRDSNGQPTERIRTILISTGMDRGSNATRLGKYMILNSEENSAGKYRWVSFGSSYGQYATRLFYITEADSQGMSGYFTGYMFHSELYRDTDPTSLIVAEYNTLGYPRSHGCMRMQVKDARWIYMNCPTGSVVEIVDGTSAPDTWLALKPALLPYGTLYDPTDPAKPGVSAEPDLPTPVPPATPKATLRLPPSFEPTTKPTPTGCSSASPTVFPDPTPSETPESTEVPSASFSPQ